MCRECGDYVAQSESVFLNHLRSKHIKPRTDTNLALVTKHLFHLVDSVHTNHWEEGLLWLRDIDLEEPSFRQSLILKIKHELEDDVTDCFEEVLKVCVESAKRPSDNNLIGTEEYNIESLWILPFIFEQLILCPNPDQPREGHKGTSLRQCITRRLRLFRSGQLKLLYDESKCIQSKSAKSFRESPPETHKCAQEAADNDNFKSAYARLVKYMPIAPINEVNIPILKKLFPKSLNVGEPSADTQEEAAPEPQRMTTRAATIAELTKKRVTITPQEMSERMKKLKKGRAPGVQVDSLDIFIKLANRRAMSHRKKKKRKKTADTDATLAAFFTIIINGEVGPRIKKLIRTTYTVALQKDPEDLKKLRPLGIPSAVRRIAAALIVGKYKSEFAKLLLPTNYAIGTNGGIDVITNTVRLGVEKYISEPEDRGELPTRALVSLDIRNMFNAVSREKLRHIIAESYPELESFADLLYADFGTTCVKRDDGSWFRISVEEGFAQGCPASPVFAAIVLRHILKKVERDMLEHIDLRNSFGESARDHDDGMGCIPIVMAYVDDVNCLLHLRDVKPFLDSFKKHGEPLGAIMNTEKT